MMQPQSPAESAQLPASITDVVAIRGGGIPFDEFLTQTWLVMAVEVQGRRFVDINTRDPRCRTYFQQNFAMVAHIKGLRDRKAKELMQALCQNEDPNEENPRQGRMPARPKRELIDQIDPVINVEVETKNGVQATVNVIPSWRDKGALQIELTQENMDLLLEDPPAVSAPFNPKYLEDYPNVSWISARNHLRITWWDSKKKTWRIASHPVALEDHVGGEVSEEEKEGAVCQAAAFLQQQYEKNHNVEDNIPCDDSGGPLAKKARCNTGTVG